MAFAARSDREFIFEPEDQQCQERPHRPRLQKITGSGPEKYAEERQGARA